jgi:hypothetical protein
LFENQKSSQQASALLFENQKSSQQVNTLLFENQKVPIKSVPYCSRTKKFPSRQYLIEGDIRALSAAGERFVIPLHHFGSGQAGDGVVVTILLFFVLGS